MIAENVADGRRRRAQVDEQLRAPRQNPELRLRDIGVGHQYRQNTRYGHYWTQNFGTR